MGYGHLLNLSCDMGSFKQQRDATLPILKIDMRHKDPPSKAPEKAVQGGERNIETSSDIKYIVSPHTRRQT